jgi:hypothetical protein
VTMDELVEPIDALHVRCLATARQIQKKADAAHMAVAEWTINPMPIHWRKYEPRRRPRLLHFDPLMVVHEPVEQPDHIPHLDEVLTKGWFR